MLPLKHVQPRIGHFVCKGNDCIWRSCRRLGPINFNIIGHGSKVPKATFQNNAYRNKVIWAMFSNPIEVFKFIDNHFFMRKMKTDRNNLGDFITSLNNMQQESPHIYEKYVTDLSKGHILSALKEIELKLSMPHLNPPSYSDSWPPPASLQFLVLSNDSNILPDDPTLNLHLPLEEAFSAAELLSHPLSLSLMDLIIEDSIGRKPSLDSPLHLPLLAKQLYSWRNEFIVPSEQHSIDLAIFKSEWRDGHGYGPEGELSLLPILVIVYGIFPILCAWQIATGVWQAASDVWLGQRDGQEPIEDKVLRWWKSKSD